MGFDAGNKLYRCWKGKEPISCDEGTQTLATAGKHHLQMRDKQKKLELLWACPIRAKDKRNSVAARDAP